MNRSAATEAVVSQIVARTPVGATSTQTCAAIRAGISRFTEHSYYDPSTRDQGWDEEEPLIVGTLPGIDPLADGVDRITQILRPLLLEIVGRSLIRRSELSRTALLLALPEPNPALDEHSLDHGFLLRLVAACGIEGAGAVESSRLGHTAVFSLLSRATQLIGEGRADRCIVGGCDSYLLEARLDHLDHQWRIRSARNVDGFIPGEAGAFLLVERRSQAEARGAMPLGVLGSFGEGREGNAVAGDRASTASGLATAIRKAVESRPKGPASPWVLCDLNGESYRSFEWGTVLARLPDVFHALPVVVHPASSIGDVGAAIGAVLVACACAAFARRYNPAPEALLWTASDDGRRAALTIRQAFD